MDGLPTGLAMTPTTVLLGLVPLAQHPSLAAWRRGLGSVKQRIQYRARQCFRRSRLPLFCLLHDVGGHQFQMGSPYVFAAAHCNGLAASASISTSQRSSNSPCTNSKVVGRPPTLNGNRCLARR